RQEELLLIAFGGVFAVVAVAVRPTRLASHLPVQLLLMTASAVLTVLILGVAGPWLGNDLPPLAAAAFATILLHFDLGLHARHAGYVFLIAAVALAALWVYAFTALMVTLGALIVWTLVLAGLGMLAYLTRRSVDHDLALHADRQGSLLEAVSEMGEGLLITDDGRFVSSNAAYLELVGYSQEERAALPSLIDLAPPEEREALGANLARRMAGGDAPMHYQSALITKGGRRVEVDVAIHHLTRDNPRRLLALVRDVSERILAESEKRESEMRFRTLFEQAQAGMSFAGLDGAIASVNAAYCDLLGYTAEELRHLSVYDVTYPDDVAAAKEAARK